MEVLLKSAKIISEKSEFNNQTKDILIKDGLIAKIDDSISSDSATEITSNDLHVSIGWFDINATIPDPGFEIAEDILSANNAAAAGGFTDVAVMPNSMPVRDSKSQIEYLIHRSSGLPVTFHPYGAVSKNLKGVDMTEMFDMSNSGAVGFSDGIQPIKNPDLLKRTLLYTKVVGKPVLVYSEDQDIANSGYINEGVVSTSLGLKTRASIAEDIMVSRNLTLAEYTEAPLHLTSISTVNAVQQVKSAQEKGLKITSDVNVLNLVCDDTVLTGFDTNYKVLPPLRTSNDKEALVAGLKDGTIQCISTNHTPVTIEDKDCEFDHADFGAIGFQSAFPALNTYLSDQVSLETIIEKLTTAPRTILGLDMPEISEGAQACLTVFDPSESFTLEKDQINSKSKNSPFIGKELKGKVLGVVNNNLSTL